MDSAKDSVIQKEAVPLLSHTTCVPKTESGIKQAPATSLGNVMCAVRLRYFCRGGTHLKFHPLNKSKYFCMSDQ